MESNLKSRQPKNRQICTTILEQIKSGALVAGDRLPPERSLSEMYGASRVTVRGSLRKLEKMRLIERRRGSGTYVSGRMDQENRVRRVALVLVSKLDNLYEDPYFAQLLISLHASSSLNKSSISLVRLGDREELSRYIRSIEIRGREFDGFLFITQLEDDEVALLNDAGVCYAGLMPPVGERQMSYVDIDNVGGVSMLTSALLSLGRKSPMFLNGCPELKVNRDKAEGFRTALTEYGVSFSEGMIGNVEPSEKEPARSVVRKLLKGKGARPFDALVVYGDWATFGAVEALREAGLKIGEDVLVGMYGGYPWVYKALGMEFATVRLPFSEQIERALRIVLQRIKDPESSVVVEKLATRLIIKAGKGMA